MENEIGNEIDQFPDLGTRRCIDMDRDQRPEVRVSDADREETVKLLERHYADGRLTFDEYSERMEAAFHARTHEDLRQTLRELPPLEQPRPPAQRTSPGRDWPSWLTPGLIIGAVIALAILPWAFGGWWFGGPHRGFFPFFPLLFWLFILLRFARPGRRRRW